MKQCNSGWDLSPYQDSNPGKTDWSLNTLGRDLMWPKPTFFQLRSHLGLGLNEVQVLDVSSAERIQQRAK